MALPLNFAQDPLPLEKHLTLLTLNKTPDVVCDLIGVVQQGRQLVASLSDDAYACAPEGIKASAIGAHYRHHIEHLQLLLSGKDCVSYDDRERDMRVETERACALERTDMILSALRKLDERSLERPLRIAHRTCTQRAPQQATTTLRRELLFLISHAIHHYAIMKLIIEVGGCQRLDDSFGVMPSTLAHKSERGCGE